MGRPFLFCSLLWSVLVDQKSRVFITDHQRRTSNSPTSHSSFSTPIHNKPAALPDDLFGVTTQSRNVYKGPCSELLHCTTKTHASTQKSGAPLITKNPLQPQAQFQALFTLFSKFYSSFLHSTCSLSVSDPLFSLSARITRRFADHYQGLLLVGRLLENHAGVGRTGLSPSLALPSSRLFRPSNSQKPANLSTTIRDLLDFKFGLLPVRSPLLRQSRLFSLPALINMLKSSA